MTDRSQVLRSGGGPGTPRPGPRPQSPGTPPRFQAPPRGPDTRPRGPGPSLRVRALLPVSRPPAPRHGPRPTPPKSLGTPLPASQSPSLRPGPLPQSPGTPPRVPGPAPSEPQHPSPRPGPAPESRHPSPRPGPSPCPGGVPLPASRTLHPNADTRTRVPGGVPLVGSSLWASKCVPETREDLVPGGLFDGLEAFRPHVPACGVGQVLASHQCWAGGRRGGRRTPITVHVPSPPTPTRAVEEPWSGTRPLRPWSLRPLCRSPSTGPGREWRRQGSEGGSLSEVRGQGREPPGVGWSLGRLGFFRRSPNVSSDPPRPMTGTRGPPTEDGDTGRATLGQSPSSFTGRVGKRSGAGKSRVPIVHRPGKKDPGVFERPVGPGELRSTRKTCTSAGPRGS